jgi:hypothetical protein
MSITQSLSRRVVREPLPVSQRWAFTRLFTNSEAGIDYDPSDLSTLYQTADGTTRVTAPGQPVGLILDKSRGLAPGSELIINGDFSDGFTGWSVGPNLTAVLADGEAEITGAGSQGFTGGNHFRTTYHVAEAGKYYTVSFDATHVSGGNLQAGMGYNTLLTVTPNASKTRYTFITTVGATATANLQFRVTFAAASGAVWRLDNISAKEILGNHAAQPTAGARPTYGVVPQGGRRNLLLRTEEIDNAVWVKAGGSGGTVPVILANAAEAPDGSVTADRVTVSRTVTTGGSFVLQRITETGTQKIASFWVKAATPSDVGRVLDTWSYDTVVKNRFAVTLTADWVRVVMPPITLTAGNNREVCTVGLLDVSSLSPNTGTTQFFLWGMQVEAGSAVTDYQKVVTALDVTSARVPTRHYLQFDGVDDSLVTNNVDFSSSNKLSVFIGLRKFSDATPQNILGYEPAIAKGFQIGAAVQTFVSTFANYNLNLQPQNSTSGYSRRLTTFAAPVSSTLYAQFDRTVSTFAEAIQGRVNGAIPAYTDASSVSDNVGTFANAPLSIGAAGGIFFNGQIFGLVARGTSSTTTEIVQAEKRLVNLLPGYYDLDAEHYIDRVETADGLPLPVSVKEAINQLVAGCKFDGNWSLIKAMCLLAGPRTLAGILVPLIGVTPTSFNFTVNDYVPKLGLKGNATNKYWNTNRSGNAENQNEHSYWVFETELPSVDGSIAMGNAGNANTAGQIFIQRSGTGVVTRGKSSTATNSGTASTNNLLGIYRTNANNYQVVTGQVVTQVNVASNGNLADNMRIFSRNNVNFSDARLAAYGMGDSFDLRILDNRLKTYLAALDAATY